jgi:YVTN family beta-propeller protein
MKKIIIICSLVGVFLSCKKTLPPPTAACIQITLSSAPGSNSQAVAINVPITPITYRVTGDTTIIDTMKVSVSGTLPPGVTAVYSAGLLTISGTPTASAVSPFVYIVTTTGNTCSNEEPTGSITVGNSTSVYAYFGNTGNNFDSVIVVNTATDSIVARIFLGYQLFGETVNGNNLYTVDAVHNAVSVINTSTNEITATLTAPIVSGIYFTGAITVSPDNSKAYLLGAPGATNGVLTVLNIATNSVITTIPLASDPLDIAISPDGSKVYVTSIPVLHTDTCKVNVINTATNTVTATIPIEVGYPQYGIAISADGSKVYVAGAEDSISVISTATNTVTANIKVDIDPFGLALSPDGSKLYVVNNASYTVNVINTATNAVIATIPLGINPGSTTAPSGISITPDGSKVYVTGDDCNIVTVISAATNTVMARIQGGQCPFGNFIGF